MKIARLYTRTAFATTADATLAQAAEAMQRYRVGSLLVMDGHADRLLGIVTDRDLAVNAAAGANATVALAMTPVVATIKETADTHEALETMRAHGVRRLMVTSESGEVRGILSVDDLVDGLAADLAAVAAVMKGEVRRDAAGLGEVITPRAASA